MSVNERPPVGPLVAYAAVTGPVWGVALAIAAMLLLAISQPMAAYFFVIPGVAIGGVMGAVLSPVITLACAAALAGRPADGIRTQRLRAAVVGAVVVLPITIAGAGLASAFRVAPSLLGGAVAPILLVIISAVSAVMAAVGAPFLHKERAALNPLHPVTRVAWWLIAPGLSFVLPAFSASLAVAFMGGSAFDDGVEPVARSVLIALAVIATASVVLLVCGIALLAIGRTTVWDRGVVVLGFAIVSVILTIPLAVSLWSGAYAPAAAAVP